MELEQRLRGYVLADREENYHDDSDFYVVAWNPTERKCEKVYIGSTRYGGGMSSVPRDWYASPEIVREARRWWRGIALRFALERARREALDPIPGRAVRVSRNRRIPNGSEVEIVRRESNPFRTYYRNGYNHPEDLSNQRVQVRTLDGKFLWFSLHQVEVVRPEPVNVFGLRRRVYRDGYATAFSRAGLAIL